MLINLFIVTQQAPVRSVWEARGSSVMNWFCEHEFDTEA